MVHVGEEDDCKLAGITEAVDNIVELAEVKASADVDLSGFVDATDEVGLADDLDVVDDEEVADKIMVAGESKVFNKVEFLGGLTFAYGCEMDATSEMRWDIEAAASETVLISGSVGTEDEELSEVEAVSDEEGVEMVEVAVCIELLS